MASKIFVIDLVKRQLIIRFNYFRPLDEKNVPKDDSLKAQTREKLTTALNNATGNQQPVS